MARFFYTCTTHGNFKVSLSKREKTFKCPTCKEDSKARIKAGSVRVVEIMDKGNQARAVEHLKDIEEIMKDRERRHDGKEE